MGSGNADILAILCWNVLSSQFRTWMRSMKCLKGLDLGISASAHFYTCAPEDPQTASSTFMSQMDDHSISVCEDACLQTAMGAQATEGYNKTKLLSTRDMY